MVCCLCDQKPGVHKYELEDKSTIDICEECGQIVYGKEFKPVVSSRLFQIILMSEYVTDYKKSKQKVLVKK